MPEEKHKPWYRQGSFWAGVALAATGVGRILVEGDWDGLDAMWQGLMAIFAGVGIIRLRKAID